MIFHRNMRLGFIIGLLFSTYFSFAQNREKAQQTIVQLCSDSLAGRGYISSGDFKAANYIASEFKKLGLKPLGLNYFQSFTLSVNTLPQASVRLGKNELIPGYDFLVSPGSASCSAELQFKYFSTKKITSKSGGKKVNRAIANGYMPVIGSFDHKNAQVNNNLQLIYSNPQLNMLAFLKPSMLWSVSRTQQPFTELWLVDSVFTKKAKTISLDVEAHFIPSYETQNVIGIVPGTEQPDSFIIFCGHYDHLGKMGEAIFYGANDNASGIAMLLDMANYFNANPQKYSIVFIAFAAEEAGLVGSKYYVEHPPQNIPLINTKFVFNMDLMGNGKDGATVVNSTVFKSEFQLLDSINKVNNYLPRLKTRGKAANSDHYYFTESGIPSFFLYTEGDYLYYHIPNDNANNLTLGPFYDRTFLLIRDFIIALNQ